MFKRMSVLVRRPDHERSTFSALWEQHAAPVSSLPRVRGYIQNHIEEEFGTASPIQADGFVELLWDTANDMAIAFASEAARPMVADEPGFLGHGSGYALAGSEFRFDASATKLIVAVVGNGDLVGSAISQLSNLGDLIRDDVTSLIAKPGMAPPQHVDSFFHLWFNDVGSARGAALKLSKLSEQAVSLGIYRVRTRQFV